MSVLLTPMSPPAVPVPDPIAAPGDPQAATAAPIPEAPPMPSATLNPDFQHVHHGLSLLGGWLPRTVEIVAVVLLITAIGWRTRRWRLIWLPVSIVIGVGAAVAAWMYMNYAGLASDPAPMLLWLCVGATVAALAIVATGWTSARWWRRVVSVLAVPVALLSTGIVLNQWVGYYPTIQAAWGAFTAGPLPNQTGRDDLAALRGTAVTAGRIVPVDIPDDASGFAHRTEYVYLPPSWFAGQTPPKLPVVMMIGGEFNTPADWVRSGQIMPEVDKFAATHPAQMPILVFVDAGGSFNNDTECVNGPRGDSADHLVKDVPAYVESTFGASADPAKWAVVGWSMGGTCAVDLTVMHPEVFHTFVDIAGNLGPNSGNKQQTIDRLYGGDANRWAAFDPTTVMRKHGPYNGVAGLFDDLTAPAHKGSGHNRHGQGHSPQRDHGKDGMGGVDLTGMGGDGEVGAAKKLCAEGEKVAITCTVYTTTGGHTWQFASGAFISSLPWLAARLR